MQVGLHGFKGTRWQSTPVNPYQHNVRKTLVHLVLGRHTSVMSTYCMQSVLARGTYHVSAVVIVSTPASSTDFIYSFMLVSLSFWSP